MPTAQSQHQQREAHTRVMEVGLEERGKSRETSEGGLYLTRKLCLDGITCVSRQGSCAFTSGQERMCGRQQSVYNAALPGAELQAAS